MGDTIDRPDIERVYALIQPYIRKTPIVDVAGADLGLGQSRVVLKLELLQRAGLVQDPRGLRQPADAHGAGRGCRGRIRRESRRRRRLRARCS